MITLTQARILTGLSTRGAARQFSAARPAEPGAAYAIASGDVRAVALARLAKAEAKVAQLRAAIASLEAST